MVDFFAMCTEWRRQAISCFHVCAASMECFGSLQHTGIKTLSGLVVASLQASATAKQVLR